MKKIFLLILLFFSFNQIVYSQELEEIVLIATTDVHGYALPYDYFTGNEKKNGTSKSFYKNKRNKEEI
ncbi:MAG: hypothetical protein KatS3mg068_0337 [Candidatus Sericytochromatia bacterium]|nr:MAG: hypothetical protein KatS3mg068_0337 [Candidatus Sericytochromatia bacterium]